MTGWAEGKRRAHCASLRFSLVPTRQSMRMREIHPPAPAPRHLAGDQRLLISPASPASLLPEVYASRTARGRSNPAPSPSSPTLAPARAMFFERLLLLAPRMTCFCWRTMHCSHNTCDLMRAGVSRSTHRSVDSAPFVRLPLAHAHLT
jgi:hypothetical protein